MENPDQSVLMVNGTYVTDPPVPDLEDLEQRDPVFPAVPVRVDGTMYTVRQPALRSAVFGVDLDTTLRRVVDTDPRRSAVTLVCTGDWRMSHTPSGSGAPLPADVPIRLEHSDRVFARAESEDCVLTVIQENYGD